MVSSLKLRNLNIVALETPASPEGFRAAVAALESLHEGRGDHREKWRGDRNSQQDGQTVARDCRDSAQEHHYFRKAWVIALTGVVLWRCMARQKATAITLLSENWDSWGSMWIPVEIRIRGRGQVPSITGGWYV